MPYLFTYGSALLRAQMERRLMGNRPFARAHLSGWRLAFRGYSSERKGAVVDLLPDGAGTVPGMLYELPDSTVHSADKAEAVEKGMYETFDVEAETDDGTRVSAVTYRLKDLNAQKGEPNRGYLFQMRQAYKEWGLDEALLDRALEHSKT